MFKIIITQFLRSLANGGEYLHNIQGNSFSEKKAANELKIGFYGNPSNNSYNLIKMFRNEGYQADLVIEEGFENHFLNDKPFWEDVPYECTFYEEGLKGEKLWSQPHYVRRVKYDERLEQDYRDRDSAAREVREMYANLFCIPENKVPLDKMLVLAQYMGHWPLIQTMKNYDVISLSGTSTKFGIFSPVPYVITPSGDDLRVLPFEETWSGFLSRAAYKSASKIIYTDSSDLEFLRILLVADKSVHLPRFVSIHHKINANIAAKKEEWIQKTNGTKFILSVCEHVWAEKGNDRLIHSFAKFVKRSPRWRLILADWGKDVEKSKKLIDELNMKNFVFWEKYCTMPLLRDKQAAADVIVGKLIASEPSNKVFELMAFGKPVITHYNIGNYQNSLPPLLNAETTNDIYNHFIGLEQGDLSGIGKSSFEWISKYCGGIQTLNAYMDVYLGVSSK